LTVIALLAAYQRRRKKIAKHWTFYHDPLVFLDCWSVSPSSVFSAMLMMGVDRNAEAMVTEDRRQFMKSPSDGGNRSAD
jgi:K(+)-stimulated pyrophosphate-energized sodium pump